MDTITPTGRIGSAPARTPTPGSVPEQAPSLEGRADEPRSHRRERSRPSLRRTVPWPLVGLDLIGTAVVAAALLPLPVAVVLAPAWVLLVALSGCYARPLLPAASPPVRPMWRVGVPVALAVELAGSVLWPTLNDRLALTLLTALVLGSVVRGAWALHHRTRRPRDPGARRRVVVLGGEAAILRTLADLSRQRLPGVSVSGVCVLGVNGHDFELPTEHGFERVLAAIEDQRADAVLAIPCEQVTPLMIRRLAWDLERTGTELLVSSGLPEVVPARTTVAMADRFPVLHVRRAELHGVRRVVKGVVERTAALLALVALAPVLLLLMLAVRVDSTGPALYRQVRVGRGGRAFTMLKLRTMRVGAERELDRLRDSNDSDGVLFKVREDPRTTRIGRVLRRFSLDELPQLWNVVRGEMALVGPRPALPEEVARYEPDTHRRMAVKPGLTGLWQVSGRSDLSWDETVRLDLFYVDNWSLGLDVLIVLRTFRAVLAPVGAY